MYAVIFLCFFFGNFMPRSGCWALHEVNPYLKKEKQCMDDVYNVNGYNQTRNRRSLIVFHGMIANMINKKFQAIIKELFIRCRKLNMSLAFNAQSYFFVLIEVYTWRFTTKKSYNKLLLIIQQTLIIKNFMKIYKKCTSEPYSFLTVDSHCQQIIISDLEKNF